MRTNERPDYVLVIDDDPEIREALEIACRMHGYEALAANDENEALDVMNNYEPALVLVDYYGVADNTRTLIQRIKALDSRVPIVLMTGAQDCRAKMKELGLTRHLAKPFNMDSLLNMLKKCRVRSSRNVSEPVAFSLFS